MGLIAQEIIELRRAQKLFENGKVDAEHINTILKRSNVTYKWARLAFDIVSAAGKPQSVEGRLHGFNILSKGELVSLPGDISLEIINCLERDDMMITRLDCKKYSATTGNLGKCEPCEHFEVTRRLLDKANA